MYEDIFESIRHAAEKRNLRERTIQLYCSDVSYFLRCTNKPVTDLTLEDADAFLTMKRLEGRSPETHNHYRSSIKFLYKRVLKIAWDDEEVPAMKRERNLPTVLTPQEIHAVIEATDNLKHKAIIATMYSSGLRVSEAVHLHYDDISRTNMTIHVRETKGRIDRYTILSQRNLDLLTEWSMPRKISPATRPWSAHTWTGIIKAATSMCILSLTACGNTMWNARASWSGPAIPVPDISTIYRKIT